jgi:formyltetrahydrofolate-dependent phosphoribosylglycinamide formyltransferase
VSLRLAVFASGGGSNLQALLDRFNARAGSPARVVVAVSDREDAGALDRARRANIDASWYPWSDAPSITARELLVTLESADVDLIALAGYLRLIPPAVVRTFRNRIVNVHPALLPAFGGKGMFGLRVHRAVLESGCTVSGATVHLVNEEYDQGAIIAQWPVPVLATDTPEVWPAVFCTSSTCCIPLQSKRWLLQWRVVRAARGSAQTQKRRFNSNRRNDPAPALYAARWASRNKGHAKSSAECFRQNGSC